MHSVPHRLQVVVDPSACALAFCPDPSYLEPPGLLFLALGSVIDVYSAFNLGRLSTLRLSSEDQPLQITALHSVQQVPFLLCLSFFTVLFIHFYNRNYWRGTVQVAFLCWMFRVRRCVSPTALPISSQVKSQAIICSLVQHGERSLQWLLNFSLQKTVRYQSTKAQVKLKPTNPTTLG